MCWRLLRELDRFVIVVALINATLLLFSPLQIVELYSASFLSFDLFAKSVVEVDGRIVVIEF